MSPMADVVTIARQLAQVCDALDAGALPTARTLAAQWGVDRRTVRRRIAQARALKNAEAAR